MALTLSVSPPKGRVGAHARQAALVRVTFDSSYPTGGESFDPKELVGFTPAAVFLSPRYASGATGSGGYVFQYDYTNKKILVFEQTDPAAAGGADVALVEVDNTQDLSATVLDVLCFSD
jgi:hypothetical protein